MGIMAKVLKAVSDTFTVLTVETRKGFSEETLLFSASGDDSVPCKGDRVLLVQAGRTGENAVAGVLNKSQGAKSGERILFARDENGKIVAKIKMLNSGNIEIEADGDCKVKAKGNIEINGSDYGGLIKIEELKTQLQKNTAILQGLLGALKTPITEPGTGSPSAFQATLITAIGALQAGDFADIENKKVVHGGG